MLGVLGSVAGFIFHGSDESLITLSCVLSLSVFLFSVIDFHTSIHFAGSVLSDRALGAFLSSIYLTAFCPQNYKNHVSIGSLWDTVFFTSLYATIKRAHHRIKFVSLIGTVFVLAGLISFVVEDLNLWPNPNRLSPLLGGMVVRYDWRDTLIRQCWKRTRKRKFRRATADDVFNYLCRVREYDSEGDHITKSPVPSSDRIDSLVQSLDILEMNSMLEMFNTQQDPLLSRELNDKVT